MISHLQEKVKTGLDLQRYIHEEVEQEAGPQAEIFEEDINESKAVFSIVEELEKHHKARVQYCFGLMHHVCQA